MPPYSTTNFLTDELRKSFGDVGALHARQIREGNQNLHRTRHFCTVVLLGSTAFHPLTTKAELRPSVNAASGEERQFDSALERQGGIKQREPTDIPEPAMPFLVGTGLIMFSVAVRES